MRLVAHVPGRVSGFRHGKYSGLGSALVCPLRMIAFRKRRFGLLNTGIYLILSGSSNRLILPGFLPNEFLWLDMARPSLSTPKKKGGQRWEVYISPNCCFIIHYGGWPGWAGQQCGLVERVSFLFPSNLWRFSSNRRHEETSWQLRHVTWTLWWRFARPSTFTLFITTFRHVLQTRHWHKC